MDFKHGAPKMINPFLLRPHLEYAVLANCTKPQKGHTPLEKKTKGSNERWVKGFRDLTYDESRMALKLLYGDKKI